MMPGRRLSAHASSSPKMGLGGQMRWQRPSPAAAQPRCGHSPTLAARHSCSSSRSRPTRHVPCRPHTRRVMMADSKQAAFRREPLQPPSAAAAGAPAVLDDSSSSSSHAAVPSSSSSSNGASSAAAAAAGGRTAPGGATITRSASTQAATATTTLEEGYEGVLPQQQASDGLFVRVRGMVKHYNTPKGVFRAVDGVDVDIEPGFIVALLGPSGSGKTTLLRLIAGLEVPTGGKILFDDLDATDLPVQDRMVGMVFQSYALFNHMTVSENIKFGLQVRGLPVDHGRRAADLLELVQLSGLGDRYPRQLSGGQRQRVALARALAASPRLLLLDEPFGALDAVVRRQLRAGLKDIVRTVGVTTVIVTHDQEEAFDLADKVVIFNRGLVEQQGSPTDIIRRPRTPFVMKFVGETNPVPSNCLLVRRSGYMTKKPLVMFRPSDIQLYTEYVEAVDSHLVTPATVTEKFNLGWVVKYVLKFDDDVAVELAVSRKEADGPVKLDVGQRLYLYVPPGCMMGFEASEIDSAPLV